jgi:hypothetical protein
LLFAHKDLAFAVLCGLLGALILAGGLWLTGNELLVEVRAGVLSIRRTWFGMFVWGRQLPLASLAGVTYGRSGTQLKDRNGTTVFYYLRALTTNGESHVVADGFVGASAARAAARRLAEQTGLKLIEPPAGPSS